MSNGSTQENTGITSDNIGGCGIGFVSSATRSREDEARMAIAKKAGRYCRDISNLRKKKSRKDKKAANRRKQELRLLAKVKELMTLHPWLTIPDGIIVS